MFDEFILRLILKGCNLILDYNKIITFTYRNLLTFDAICQSNYWKATPLTAAIVFVQMD